MITYLLPPKETVKKRYQSDTHLSNYYSNRSKKIEEQLSRFAPQIIVVDEAKFDNVNPCLLILEDELDPIEDLLKSISVCKGIQNVIVADNLNTARHLLNNNCEPPLVITLDLYYGVTNPIHKNKLSDAISVYNEIKSTWKDSIVIILTQNPTAEDVVEFSKVVLKNEDYFLGKDKGMMQVFDLIESFHNIK